MAMAVILVLLMLLMGFTKGQNNTATSEVPTTTSTLSDDLFGEIVTTTSNTPVITITTAPTTTEAVTIINSALLKPSGLAKTGATETTIRLRYSPPPNYLGDNRYTHFRVEYITINDLASKPWDSIEVPKRSDANNLVVTNLLEGVLYLVRMRTQGRNSLGTLVLSPPTDSIYARTRPLKVTRLSVVRSPSDWSNVTVTWYDPPVEAFRSEFDSSVLTYYIEGLSPGQAERYPRKNITFEVNSLLDNRNPAKVATFAVVPGAPYLYEVVTYSGETDKTSSEVVYVSKINEIPGPLLLTKTNFTESSMNVSWTPRPDVINTSTFIVTWSREGSSAAQNVTTTSTSYEIADLDPGVLYVVLVRSEQRDNAYGKLSEASVLTARTRPPKATDILVVQRSDRALRINFTIPDERVDVLVTYKIHQSDEIGKPASNNEVTTNSVTLLNLQSAALYSVMITTLSKGNDPTNNTELVYARTNPRLPRQFRATSESGTIFASWWAPTMYESAQWSYKIDYYPRDDRSENRSICQVKGQDYHKIRLPDANPGRGYVVTMTTVAGKNCEKNSAGNYVTYSGTAERIAYTQPDNPEIDYWAQVTLNSIRIAWNPPSGSGESMFEKYVVEVKRIRGKRNYVPFRREIFVKVVDKDQVSILLDLDQGVDYRAEVTTLVGSLEEGQKSIVIRGRNSIEFKTWHRYYEPFPFPRLQWRFTTCGRSGRYGPSKLLCRSEYSDTNLNNLVEIRNGIQHWMAPVDGLYRIVAAGAGYEGPGGFGATVSGLFHLKEGAIIKIAVGQRGSRRGQQISVGGAGGSFVVASSLESQGVEEVDTTEVMLVAGGAGSGAVGMSKSSIPDARLNHNGGDASEVGRTFGRGGVGDGTLATPGSVGADGTGGGAGYNGIADAPNLRNGITERAFAAVGFSPFTGNYESFNATERAMYIPLSGGRYENNDDTFSEGGFGGGGSGYSTGVGGGGGYSGGGAGPIGGYSGGGGSFIKFTGGIQQAELTNDKAGFVIVTLVGVPQLSPIPLTFYLVISFVAGILITFFCGAGLFGVNKCAEKYIAVEEYSSPIESSYNPAAIRPESDVPVVIGNPLMIRDLSSSDRESSFKPESEVEMEATFNGNIPDDEEIFKNKRLPLQGWPSEFDNLENIHLPSDRDSDSLSSISSVSSMATGVTESKFEVDPRTGKLRYRGKKVSRMNSSFTGFESTDAETVAQDFSSSDESSDDDASLPSGPPTPPPAPELAGEEQKAEFRKKLSMFHEMAQKGTQFGGPPKKLPSYVPSTNL